MHKTNWTYQTYFKPVERIKATHYLQLYNLQEVMESVAFPDKINSKSTESMQKCSKCSSFHWNHSNTPFTFWTVTQRETHE